MALTKWQKDCLSKLWGISGAIPDNYPFQAEVQVQIAQLTIALAGATVPATAAIPGTAVAVPAARTAQPRGRPRTMAAAAAETEGANFGDQVLAKIPPMGLGIAQTQINLPGVKPNTIGMALSRMAKSGVLIKQGVGKTTTWFRAGTQQEQRAA